MTPRDWVPELPPGRPLHLPGRGVTFVREVAGPPGAPVLVLLHGWTVTADLNWFGAYAPLGEQFRVIALDHRGHGRGIRTRRRFRLTDCADDAVAVADALGIDRFIPVGYSMGGPIATLIWQRHRSRVEGVVLCATASNFGDTWMLRAQFALFRPISWMARAMPRRVGKPLFDRVIWQRTRDSGLMPWIIDEIRSGDPRLVVEAGTALGQFNSGRWVGEIDVPTSIVVMDHDSIVDTARQQRMAALLPSARVWHVDADHDYCVRHPRQFANLLLEACSHVRDQREAAA